MNDITYTKASDVSPAELAKLNEENARKGLVKGQGIESDPVVEHKTVGTEEAEAPKVTSPAKKA